MPLPDMPTIDDIRGLGEQQPMSPAPGASQDNLAGFLDTLEGLGGGSPDNPDPSMGGAPGTWQLEKVEKGVPIYKMMNPEGSRILFQRMNGPDLMAAMRRKARDEGVPADKMDDFLRSQVGGTEFKDGKVVSYTDSKGLTFDSRGQPSGGSGGGQAPGWTNPDGSPRQGSGAPLGRDQPTPGAGPTVPRAGGLQTPGGGPTVLEEGGGTMLDPGGGGGGGPPPFDIRAPLGINPPPRQNPGGDPRFQSDLFGRGQSPLDSLGPESSGLDAMLAAWRSQEGDRDAALGIYGGMYEGYENDPLRQGAAQSAQGLLDNPFSLDDQTVQRMMGQQGELISRNAERQGQLSAQRAAAQGTMRSGGQAADQDRIQMAAGQQLGDAQRGLLTEQATRRPQEIQSALGAASGVLNQQQSARERMGTGAAGVLGGGQVADAAVLAGMSGGQAPAVNLVGSGARQGPISGVAFSGDPRLNPFR